MENQTISILKEEPYRSQPMVNMDYDMVRVTLSLPKHRLRELKRLLESLSPNTLLNGDGNNPCELHYFKKKGNYLVCEKCGKKVATR
jgi:hypothetical protein